MSTFEEIAAAASAYAKARAVLRERVERLRAEIDHVKAKAVPGIRAAVEGAMQHQATLHEAIAAAPELFVKPKTQVVAGIKVGYQTSRERLAWENAAQVCAGIRRHFPESADVLIQTWEKPIDQALRALSREDLRRIGVQVWGGEDEIVIRPTDADTNKLINALLREVLGDEDEIGL